MKAMTKIAIVSTGLFSLGALTACQTTTTPQKDPRSMKGHEQKRMSPEKREAFKQHKAERKQAFAQMQKACDGKAVGSAVQVKAGERTIDGTCIIKFKADRKEMKHVRGEHRPMRGEVRGLDQKRGEPLTNAKRAELIKAYDLRLAQRQAQQQAIAQACAGQTDGKIVQIKMGEKSVNGKCEVRFQPNSAPALATNKTA